MVRLKNLIRLTFELAYGRNISGLIRCLEIGSSIAVQLIDCDFGDDDGFSSLLMDLSLVPTSIGVAGMPNHDVVTFALNSSSALRSISFECAFHEDRASERVQQYVRELWISPSVDDISSGVIAGCWIHLETLVCCDYALEYILILLSTPTELPCARELSTIRLIQTSSRKNLDLSAQQGVQERFMLARKDCPAIRLVIESHVLQRDVGQRVMGDVEALFEFVEYRFFEEVPTMAYPDVCKRGWSAKYPRGSGGYQLCSAPRSLTFGDRRDGHLTS
ncbi:hypothetical protein A0H81_13969 [Grifola frondosa]|uniref:F-box domain-containing protein n=1 Tax=Grifola frondosa TaxID=5627 RepID=A0A1C7LMQ0_GRIFR|nr:hypothetical protein A0H81_13969 [Grifola frondosa]